MVYKIDSENALVVFQDKKIRRIRHNKEWYFSVVDVVSALTDSPTPRQYWGKVKGREFNQIELSPIWVQLKLEAEEFEPYDYIGQLKLRIKDNRLIEKFQHKMGIIG
tara:strand:- start:135 stop:455 length:321 start_codon:yes stop_codon:yes gene_type:complete